MLQFFLFPIFHSIIHLQFSNIFYFLLVYVFYWFYFYIHFPLNIFQSFLSFLLILYFPIKISKCIHTINSTFDTIWL